MSSSGFFVAIEGVDGAGTTTQTQLVRQVLERAGRLVHSTREPSDLDVGRLIRAFLSGRSLHEHAMALLFAADRLQHYHQEVAPLLERGAVVLTDRYLLSSLVYQGEVLGEPQAGGWVHEINRFARAPDLTVLVSVTAEEAARRRAARAGTEERYDARALQARLVERYARAVTTCSPHLVVDGHQAPDAVAAQIAQAILAA